MLSSKFDLMLAAKTSHPSIKWQYTKLNDIISELMPIDKGSYWVPGRFCAAYDPSKKVIVRVEEYCCDDNHRFPTEKEAQAYIDSLVF